MEIKEYVMQDLNIPVSLVNEALDSAYNKVFKFALRKRSGGLRHICQPSNKLKMLQYWIMYNICSDMPISEHAYAFKKNVSIVDNVTHHLGNKYYLKIDLKDFFPSIHANDYIKLVKKWHAEKDIKWVFNDEATKFLERCCFDINSRLPIGYPSSPPISNIVMYQFDQKIIKSVSNKRLGTMKYTRYADDLTFSTNKKGACQDILNIVIEIIESINSPKLEINESKVYFASATGGSAFITGLRITKDNRITIHRKMKDHIRLMLSLLRKSQLNEQEYRSLLGYLSYVMYVDPNFYTKLQLRYFKEIALLKVRP